MRRPLMVLVLSMANSGAVPIDTRNLIHQARLIWFRFNGQCGVWLDSERLIECTRYMEPLTTLLGAAACSFSVALVLLVLMLHYADRVPHDHPNHRSLHDRPVPIVGGVAIMIAVFVVASIFSVSGMRTVLFLVLALSGVIFVVSVLDDTHRLSVKFRLVVQLAAASASVWKILAPVDPLLYLLAVFAIVWSMNLFNFMDGIDGFAGGMGVFGFSFLAWAVWNTGDYNLTMLLLVASASAAFLVFNLPPARVFLGDGGSVPMGFLAAAAGLIGYRDGIWPAWFPVLVFSPFVWDASVTLLRRIFSGGRFWLPHNEHFYQKAILMGYTHWQVTRFGYLLMVAAGMSAVWILHASALIQMIVSGMWLLGFALGSLWLEHAWRRREDQ